MNVSAPQWKWSHSWTEANGSVIDASSRDQYCGDGEESWRGNIIFMGEGSGCSEEHKNQICLNWNCSGIICKLFAFFVLVHSFFLFLSLFQKKKK